MANKSKNQTPTPTPTSIPTPAPGNEATMPESQPAPKRRGRTHLTQADKDHMQACRKVAAEAKANLAAVLGNPGITNPEVWVNIPPIQFDLIGGVIKTVKALKANASMATAQAQYLAACKASGEKPDETLMAAVPAVNEPTRHKYSEAEKAALSKAHNEANNDLTRALCTTNATDHRVWLNVPSATLDAIAGVTQAQAGTMNAKRVSEAKANLAAVLANAGQTPA